MYTTRNLFLMFLSFFCFQTKAQNLNTVFDRTKTLLLSDTAYATEQSYRLTDDVKYDRDAKGYYQSLSTDGSWADLNYHTEERSAWRPSWHLYRLMLLVREYHKNNDNKYLDAIHRALRFWINNDFICVNWWQNQINVPYAYATIMLMLDKNATATELTYLNTILVKRAQQKAPTGQNKIWQHDIESRIALIHHDEVAFALAIKNMQSVINISVSEGIQPDYSFQQHGPMLQFGNYGLHFINSLLFWMTVSANTPFAFDKDKQQMLFDYCSKGIRWSVYKGAMDITAIGRQFRKDAAIKRGKNLLEDFNLLKSFDNTDACKYALDGLTDNCPVNANKAFWRTDYMVQLKSNHYMMSVKTHAPGVSKVESINSENKKGAFLNDGVTLIQQSGKEYQDIQPLWNWTMLPGITCDTTTKPNDVAVFKTNNLGTFTGLVSDGVNGISAMTYNRLGIKALKSYFLSDDMLICLGTGIESLDLKNVVTTIDQSFYGGKFVQSSKSSNTNPWVWHNNIGYIMLGNKQKVITQVKKQLGAWDTIDGASSAQVLKDTVFTIYLPHTQTNSYAYLVKPETNIKELDKMAKNTPVNVVANTPQMQVIQLGNTLLAVLYQPGSVNFSGMKIQADKACMLICKKTSAKPEIWISDPSRTQNAVNLSVNGKTQMVAFPQGNYLGSSVKLD